MVSRLASFLVATHWLEGKLPGHHSISSAPILALGAWLRRSRGRGNVHAVRGALPSGLEVTRWWNNSKSETISTAWNENGLRNLYQAFFLYIQCKSMVGPCGIVALLSTKSNPRLKIGCGHLGIMDMVHINHFILALFVDGKCLCWCSKIFHIFAQHVVNGLSLATVPFACSAWHLAGHLGAPGAADRARAQQIRGTEGLFTKASG